MSATVTITNLGAEKRRQRALDRLGTDEPRCLYCGESDPRCLERHHIAGRKYSQAGAIVCRNCHRKLSDMQRDHPPALDRPDPPLLECVGHLLLGLADLFETLVGVLREYGRALIEAAVGLPRPYGVLTGGAL